ncbi:hypothetical protein [Arthrobacter sp. StoSoilA2]|uniref:hypothetical protein n=1 Tax=Arthrobacter sp. StoSoilA2 TaxID=2830990 RepID=UPI001CC401B6|nr:hypothetical protein [Arthrobacter sp. StoSoilA2]
MNGPTLGTCISARTAPRPYKPGVMSLGWIVTTWNRPVSSLASAPAMPTSATGVYVTSNPLGCNDQVQSPKG